ncbi:MAG: CDGSH iron-sulfur domain-containing protein [Elusimicrobia bacterium]|nr:CDGSH iron-sulfur domain-containing protein [Elusimicrobiota bacterium]
MSEPKIAQRSPYVKEEQPGRKAWCACGHSQNQPYCDGSHARLNTGISPVRVEITESKRIAWCGCKHSGNKPYCDGTHAKLGDRV